MKKIVLLGYMGSGKSTVGNALSGILSIPFVDLDHKIEEVEGMSISQLFDAKGEIYFRRKEREILLSLVQSEKAAIIATGGGTPCYGDTMQQLLEESSVTTIYLNVTLDELVNRLTAEKTKRPLISHLENRPALHDFVRKHLFERSYYYNQSEHVINANAVVTQITELIVGKLF